MGLLISMVFRPVYKFINRLVRERRHLAAAISTLLMMVGVILPLTLLSVVLVENTAALVRYVSDTIHTQNPGEVQLFGLPFVSEIYEKINSIVQLTPAEFTDRLKEIAVVVISFLTKFVGGFAATVPGKLVSGAFFLISFYFGLVDGPAVAKFVRDSLPFAHHETDDFFSTVYSISKGVVLGTLVAGIVQGAVIGLGYWIFGIPRAFFFGSLTVIFSFIPLFGGLPTGLGGVIYLMAKHRVGAAIGMLIVFGIGSISDNIAKQWVLKGHSELHPLIGLISVLGGLKLFGFSGLFFGPLIAALTIAVIQLTLQEQHRTNL